MFSIVVDFPERTERTSFTKGYWTRTQRVLAGALRAPPTAKLFAHSAFVNAGPVAAFWFVFWHDLWANNNEIECVDAAADLLDPQQPAAIAVSPAPRDKLVATLAKRDGLREWITDKVLDVLYDGVEKRDARYAGLGANPMSSGEASKPQAMEMTATRAVMM